LPRSERPASLISGQVLFGPHLKSRAFFLDRIFHTRSRIRFDELGFMGPAKQATHGVKKVALLMGRFRPPLAAGDDGRTGILLIGCLPAVSITCSKIFSRWRRVATESAAQPLVSR
jgi:hypothetical protein